MDIAVFINEHKPTNGIDKLILKQAEKVGFTVNNEHPDVVFFVGGDGTFLRAVRHYLPILDQVSFIGISNGHLGFFYDFNKEEIPHVFSLLKNKQFVSTKHRLLSAELTYQDASYNIKAVNEIRLENPFHTLVAKVNINGETLEEFKGNGLVVSSGLGSSAYNKSLGGSLFDNQLDLMQLTEIASLSNNLNHSLGSSLILSGDSVIDFSGDFSSVVVGYDDVIVEHSNLKKVTVKLSNQVVSLLHEKGHTYIGSLKRSFVK